MNSNERLSFVCFKMFRVDGNGLVERENLRTKREMGELLEEYLHILE